MVRSLKRNSIKADVDHESSKSSSSKRRKTSEKLVSQEHQLFSQLLADAGFIIASLEDEENELSVDQMQFLQKLTIALTTHADSKIVEKFVDGLQQHFEDFRRFCTSLLPTKTSSNCPFSSHGAQQDSLARLLLATDALQLSVATCLLEKLAELSLNDEAQDHQMKFRGIDVPQYVISQIRWLEKVANSKGIIDKIFEILPVCSEAIQRELIACLPELVADSYQGDVIKSLCELLRENSCLTTAILDALSNMNLQSNDEVEKLRKSVIELLDSSNRKDLPIVVKFLLQTLAEHDATEVISEIRSKIDWSTSQIRCGTTIQSNKESPWPVRKNELDESYEVILLDVIKSGLRFQKSVASAWIKAIERVNSAAEHKDVDMFVLLIMHTISSSKKSVEALFKAKIKSGLFTEENLINAFESRGQVLREYFDEILNLADNFLRSSDPGVADFGCIMYKQAFINFDAYCQQELIVSLVTHVGSGFSAEVESSLQVLNELIKHHRQLLKPFTVFLKGMLDYLDNLTVVQIRSLFCVLSQLSCEECGDSSFLGDDEILMLIRKQLASSRRKYKRIGVIGAVMVVRSLACDNSKSSHVGFTGTQDASKTLDSHAYKQIISLLELVKSSVKMAPEAAALFYDELADVVQEGSLDRNVLHWIAEYVVADFQKQWLVDADIIRSSEDPQLQLAYNLGDSEEGGIALNILPILLSCLDNSDHTASSSSRPVIISGDKLYCLAPHFRLLRMCEQRKSCGKLDEVDALLSCPLALFSDAIFAKFSSMKELDQQVVCLSLLHAINWMREVCNGFSCQDDPEIRHKLIARIEVITDLTKVLEKCISETHSFEMPIAQFDLEELSVNPSKRVSHAANGKDKDAKAKKKAKRKRVRDDLEDGDGDSGSECNEEVASSKSSNVSVEKHKSQEKALSMEKFPASWRELDMDVFNILIFESESKEKSCSGLVENVNCADVPELKASHLVYLLSDLHRKLDYSLASCSLRRSPLKCSSQKQVGFSRLSRQTPVSIVRCVIKMLPSLLRLLERAMTFFEDMDRELDSAPDCIDSDSGLKMAACYEHLLGSLQAAFSWTGFKLPENRKLLESCLAAVEERVSASGNKVRSFPDLVRLSFNYFKSFSATAPNIICALLLLKVLLSLQSWQADLCDSLELESVCVEFLKRSWMSRLSIGERGGKHVDALAYIFRLRITSSKQPIRAIEMWCSDVVSKLLTDDLQETPVKEYPTLDRSTFPAFFRVMFEELVASLKSFLNGPTLSAELAEVVEERLVSIHTFVKVFQSLASVVKDADSKSVFSCCLKYSRVFLESFMRLAMPTLDMSLRTHKDKVHATLKSLQLVTRTLQHICGHSKVSKDLSLTAVVPALKKCLEAFVFRVKAMLAFNNCDSAFWLGNLKNRDLHGKEILSQSSQISQCSHLEDEDSEEGPEASDNDDETAPTEEGLHDAEHEEDSYSESF